MKPRPTNKQLDELVNNVKKDEEFDCSDNIVDCIKSGHSVMRSRYLVLCEELGIKTGWIIALLVLVAVINLNLFILSRGPQWEFIEFGTSGIGVILKNLPFGFITFALLLLVFAVVVMKQFSWSYMYPFKVFIVLLVTGVFVAGGFAYATGINEKLYHKLVEEQGAGDSLLAKILCITANQHLKSNSALMGEVMYIDSSNLVIQTPTLDVVTVKVDENTQWPGMQNIYKFQIVKMIGERNDDIFLASSIKKHEDENAIMKISRDAEDCIDEKEWQHKIEVLEKRRHAVIWPLSPVMGTANLIQSIY